MAQVNFKRITKIFGEGNVAVDDLSLEIKDKEFMVLVGPSGCGKTTTLRMLAGLETPSEGEIYIGKKEITNIAPKDRDIAMVFQSYALYPHMSVRENMAFGLKNRELSFGEKLLSNISHAVTYGMILVVILGISYILNLVFTNQGPVFAGSAIIAFILGLIIYPDTREVISQFSLKNAGRVNSQIKEYNEKNFNINKRIEQTARILEIEELLDRKPKELSGGQRQRVAVGRAIIRNPNVFLMDEPLSNLDAKLRNQTRAELASLQRRLETTTLYVTHDQVEAMTLGHRIAVMNKGIIEQVGTPEEVYGQPRTAFVAGFIGSPSMNLIEGTLMEFDGQLQLQIPDGPTFSIPKDIPQVTIIENWLNKRIILGFRPEHTVLNSQDSDMVGIVTFSEAVGSITSVFVDFEGTEVNLVKQGYEHYPPESKLSFSLVAKNIHLFDPDSSLRIEMV